MLFDFAAGFNDGINEKRHNQQNKNVTDKQMKLIAFCKIIGPVRKISFSWNHLKSMMNKEIKDKRKRIRGGNYKQNRMCQT